LLNLQRSWDDPKAVRYSEHLNIGRGPVEVMARKRYVDSFRICTEQRRQLTTEHTRPFNMSL
jgi:hypothetical protein